uniref:Putative secreted peptide n=1 Tax=Anopheles braziliensis TaxID=58242 RepID=A0A2M3ZU31_9DIPT
MYICIFFIAFPLKQAHSSHLLLPFLDFCIPHIFMQCLRLVQPVPSYSCADFTYGCALTDCTHLTSSIRITATL